MSNTSSKNQKQLEAAEAVDSLFICQGLTFTPQLMLLGRISAACHVNEAFQDFFTVDELETVAVMIEHFKRLTVIYADYYHKRELSESELDEVRRMLQS